MVKFLASFLFIGLASNIMASVCPSTFNTNTDCGFLITISAGNSLSGTLVPNANPYDGSDDALVGVINNSGSTYTGSFTLSGSGNGGGIFGFDGDGICAYVNAAYCAKAATGYEGPLTTFSNINALGTLGTVNIAGLMDGSTTYFSIEGAPASINPSIMGGTPEPGTVSLLSAGLLVMGYAVRRRRAGK